jgi:hypothetical protein
VLEWSDFEARLGFPLMLSRSFQRVSRFCRKGVSDRHSFSYPTFWPALDRLRYNEAAFDLAVPCN